MDLTADKPTPTGEPDPERAETATKTAERTADEIQEAMKRRIESIKRRADALKGEMTVQGLTIEDQPAPEWVKSHPEQVALAAAGVGAALAFATGLPGKLRRRREKKRRQENQEDVLRYYLSAVVDDAARRRLQADGAESSEQAMHEALRASGPVIYAQVDDVEVESRSALRQTLSLVLKTAAGFAVKAILDEVTQRLTGEDELFEALDHADDGTLEPPEDGAMAFSAPLPADPPRTSQAPVPPTPPPGAAPVPSPS